MFPNIEEIHRSSICLNAFLAAEATLLQTEELV